jgi:hypothetical protein
MASRKKVLEVIEAPPSVDRSYRQRLVDLRNLLEEAMKVCEPSVLPNVAGQYRQVLKDLASLPDDSVKSEWELAIDARRARRASVKSS